MEKKSDKNTIEKIAQEVIKHTKAFEDVGKNFEKIDKKFEQVDKRFDKFEKTNEKIVLELTKHSERMETFVTKDEFKEFKNEVITRSDKMMVILNRLDQERYFTFERVNRLEKEVEKHTSELKEIKEVLHIK